MSEKRTSASPGALSLLHQSYFSLILCCLISSKFIPRLRGLAPTDNDLRFVVVLGLGGVYVSLTSLRLGDFLSSPPYNRLLLMPTAFNILCSSLSIIRKASLSSSSNCWITSIRIALCVFENLSRAPFERCLAKSSQFSFGFSFADWALEPTFLLLVRRRLVAVLKRSSGDMSRVEQESRDNLV